MAMLCQLPHPAPPPQALLSLDSNGRQVLPPDAKTDLSRAFCLALAAAPLLDASRLGERSLTSRELVRLLVSSVRSSAEVQQVRAGSCRPVGACRSAAVCGWPGTARQVQRAAPSNAGG